MKIEKLSRGKSKKIVLSIIILLFIIGVVYITNSKAKYQVTKNVQIVNGNVNYSLADFNLMAIYLQNKEGEEGIPGSYSKSSTGIVPSTGYSLRPLGSGTYDSYCMVDNVKNNTGITITQEGDGVNFTGIKKQGTKCYLYFDILKPITVTEFINSRNPRQGQTQFTGPDTGDHTGVVYSNTDDLGTTYYFRGKVKDNWVKFGKNKNQQDMYWRIIRINGNGSIRMIYTGSGSPTTTDNGYTSQGDQTNITNNGTTATNYTYNDSSDQAEYVGFKYTKGQARGTGSKSNVLTQLETWFKDNMLDEQAQLDTEAGFCNDRTSYTGSIAGSSTASGTGTGTQYFGPLLRNKPKDNNVSSSNPAKPVFTCPETSDLFTKRGSAKGNEQLTYPVGLITADEVTFAGGIYATGNSQYYLYTSRYYWTMSPYDFRSQANVFYVNTTGYLGFFNVGYTDIGVRPVINLKAGTAFKAGGTGEYNKPYEVS